MNLWMPGVVMAIAAAGSGIAAVRAGQPPVLRLAHVIMAIVMLSMLIPAGPRLDAVSVAGLSVACLLTLIRGVSALDPRRPELHRSGLPCAVDLAGMALVLGISAFTSARLALVVLLAMAWAVSSLWAHAEVALRSSVTPVLAFEAAIAFTGATAMALMAAAMT